MTNGIFEKRGACGYARTANAMCTQSETAFEWSVKFVHLGRYQLVGIASQLEPKYPYIWQYDQNAILYFSNGREDAVITMGSETIHSNLRACKTGEVIRFSFQPKIKKLLIDLPVRN